jgi:hypothetical protein
MVKMIGFNTGAGNRITPDVFTPTFNPSVPLFPG